MRTDTEAEASILWPPDMRNWLIRKDPNGGEDWNQEEKRTTENEIGSMASPTRWTWVWASSWNWWWAGKPGMLQSMGSKMVGHDWVTELNWTELLSHSDSLWPPRDFPGKNTGVGCHSLHQGMFLTQRLNPHLLCLWHCRKILYSLSPWGSPVWAWSQA